MAKRLKVGDVRNGKEIVAILDSLLIDGQWRKEFTWRCLDCGHTYDSCFSSILCPACKEGIKSNNAMWSQPQMAGIWDINTPKIKWTSTSIASPKENGQYIIGTVNDKGVDVYGCALWFNDHWQSKSNSHKNMDVGNWFHIRELKPYVEALHVTKKHVMTAKEIKDALIKELTKINDPIMLGIFNIGEFSLWPQDNNVLEITFSKNHLFFKDVILDSLVPYEDILKKIVSPQLKTNLLFGD
jgi:hypothetical protein